jgi:hypothetical protein
MRRTAAVYSQETKRAYGRALEAFMNEKATVDELRQLFRMVHCDLSGELRQVVKSAKRRMKP